MGIKILINYKKKGLTAFLLSLFSIILLSSNAVGKPKYLWFDAEANFKRFSNQDTIRFYLDKTKETGFTDIIVDVRPIYGEVLYKKTSFMKELTKVGKFKRTIDWDYLQFFIDEARKRKLRVTVSTTIFPAGHPGEKTGSAYTDKRWKGKTAIEHLPGRGFLDIKNDPSKVAAFLNPALPEVQDYALKFIKEIVTNYDIDGYVLDYCRYPGIESDFSDPTRKLFEKYMGEKVVNFPNDIFSWEMAGSKYERKDGKHAKMWFEFRSKVIHDFIKKAKEEIKAIKPKVMLEYWTASWYSALYQQGQNWASKSYDPSLEFNWASSNYKNTGFAEHLDAFIIGTYLDKIYGLDDPESIEYGLKRGQNLLKGDTKMHGSIYALNHKNNIEDAAYICLMKSDGLMVFDIVQVIEFNQWAALKRGIERSGF